LKFTTGHVVTVYSSNIYIFIYKKLLKNWPAFKREVYFKVYPPQKGRNRWYQRAVANFKWTSNGLQKLQNRQYAPHIA